MLPDAAASSASRSTWLATNAPTASICAASFGCSSACTKPRCRSGNPIAAERGSAPNTAIPACAMPWRTSASCRGLATLFSTTPASRTSGRIVANPSATAAADCACPETSSTKTTGQPIRAAASALAPVPASPGLATPSNKPIDPSAMISSAPAATLTNPCRRAGDIAQVSRLTETRPAAAV